MVAGDFNGDGIADLATGGYDTDNVSILIGNGDGTFTVKSTFSTGAGQLAEGDFNGDGLLDLAMDGSVWLGKGDGTFTVKATPSAAGGQWGTSTAMGYRTR